MSRDDETTTKSAADVGDAQAIQQSAARKWDAVARAGRGRRRLWQQSLTIRQHINNKICGQPLPRMNEGLNLQLERQLNGRVLRRGLSIGCGKGQKEMALLKQGLVEHFDCYDISAESLRQGRQIADKMGLKDRISFHAENAFEKARDEYDFIHWNSALHHMLDVEAAVKWSRDRLCPNGVLYVREYAGPSRFQFTERQIELATRFRTALPERFLLNPKKTGYVPLQPKIIPLETIIASDPTESVDSARIVPALQSIFPEARLWHLGGAIYYVALTGIIGNFDEEEDQDWLQMALVVDDMCIELGENMIIAALAVKQE